jgi:hypothetical protein
MTWLQSRLRSSLREKVRLFYVWMAAACAVVAFGGFAPTYWLQLPAGPFVGSPLVHIHGVLFSSWTLPLLSQTLLVANGRLRNHRAWGPAGISLATAMVFMGLAAAIQTLTAGLRAGYGDHSRAFLILPVSAMVLFAGFFIAAIAFRGVRRPWLASGSPSDLGRAISPRSTCVRSSRRPLRIAAGWYRSAGCGCACPLRRRSHWLSPASHKHRALRRTHQAPPCS